MPDYEKRYLRVYIKDADGVMQGRYMSDCYVNEEGLFIGDVNMRDLIRAEARRLLVEEGLLKPPEPPRPGRKIQPD